MQLIKYLSLLGISTLMATSSSAETVTGCRIGNDEFLYTTYLGVLPYPVSQWYIPTFPTYTTPIKEFKQEWYNNYSSCPQFVGQPNYGAQCAVQGITTASGGSVQNLGQVITYTITYACPMDNKIIVLVLAVGAFSVFFTRRQIA